MVKAGDGAVPAMPVIVLERLTRTLHGAAGERVELPLLSLRLLETLAAERPAFVGADVLLRRVWPDTHIGADALKQRVRLLRLSLTAAGYDPQWLDSVRGEGYALRATLRDAGADLPLEVDARRPPTKHPLRVTAPGWIALGLAACAVALLIVSALRSARPVVADASIGPSPVRIGIAAPAGSVVGSELLDALAGTAHLLMVPVSPRGGLPSTALDCETASPIHLCLRVTPVVGDTARVSLSLLQLSSGAVLLRADAPTRRESEEIASFALQLAQYASPGVLRWLGGRTGDGDHAFTQFREGARLLGSCDVPARDDVIAGLRVAAERSPNFLPGRAMLVFHEIGAAVTRMDSVSVERALRDAESVVTLSADLALAHLAIARGAAMLGRDSLAWSATARALRLQPVLATIVNRSSPHDTCRSA